MVDSYTAGFEKSAGAILVGYVIAAATFLFGYCIYFNYVYRNDCNIRKNLFGHGRRKVNKSNYAFEYVLAELENCSPFGRQFIDEIRLCQKRFAHKDYEGSVVHLANALAWSEKPRRLLEVMRMTLPPSMYKMLIREILNPVVPKGDVRTAVPKPLNMHSNCCCKGCYRKVLS